MKSLVQRLDAGVPRLFVSVSFDIFNLVLPRPKLKILIIGVIKSK